MIAPLSIVVIGFVLGMRHPTDRDPVVAVTTIVGRQPHLASTAALGSLWGVGHTMTTLLVGGAIIILGA